MVTIWFEPHATTTDNESGLASGWNDSDLSPLGITQADEWPERCRDRKLDIIFCSDTQRAVKSAMPTARSLKLPIYVDERLRECNYGEFTGKPSELIRTERPKRINEPFPNGESYVQCMDRMKHFLKDLQTKFKGKTILIVGHRATHMGLNHWILGMRLEECTEEQFVWQPGWQYKLNEEL